MRIGCNAFSVNAATHAAGCIAFSVNAATANEIKKRLLTQNRQRTGSRPGRDKACVTLSKDKHQFVLR